MDANVVYGEEHLIGYLRIVLEAEKRKIMLTNRREMELLIRLTGTNQIEEAIRRAGLKKDICDATLLPFHKIANHYANLKAKLKANLT